MNTSEHMCSLLYSRLECLDVIYVSTVSAKRLDTTVSGCIWTPRCYIRIWLYLVVSGRILDTLVSHCIWGPLLVYLTSRVLSRVEKAMHVRYITGLPRLDREMK